ncbi:MAG: EamA family transporter [Anaerovoracaceae bacterium]
MSTGGSWLCYHKALQDGPASVVVPVDKLSVLTTVFFSWIVFGEKLCCCEELLDTEEEFVEDAAGQHI